MGLKLALIPKQSFNASANGPSIFFQLCFPRAACADAAALSREAAAPPQQPRQPVAQLGQFHLKTPCRTAGPLGKDVEDQLTTVRDRAAEQPFQVTGLYRGELPVGDHQGGLAAADLEGGFLKFSGAPERLGIGLAPALAGAGHRLGASTPHQPFQLGQIPLVALLIATGEREQKHPFFSGRSSDAGGLGFVRCEGAKVPQVALFKSSPAIGLQWVRDQKLGRASSIGRGAGCKAQPVPRSDVEGYHGVAWILGKPFAGKRAADQSPSTAAPPRRCRQMLQRRIAAGERAQPKQAAEATAVQHQMQWHFQIQHEICKAFEAQQIGAAVFGMTAMAQALQLPLLAGAQTTATPAEMGLLQRFSNQAPAERKLRESPGRRVR